MIRFINADQFTQELELLVDQFEDNLVQTIEEVQEFVATEIANRMPVDRATMMNESIEPQPVRKEGDHFVSEIRIGGKASKYAFVLHETLEIGESGLSYDVSGDAARTQFASDGVRRLGKQSVLKDRQGAAQGIRIGGKFVDRAFEENADVIQGLLEEPFNNL